MHRHLPLKLLNLLLHLVHQHLLQLPNLLLKNLLLKSAFESQVSDPVVTRGIQAPTVIEEPTCVLEGEGQSNWMMWADFAMNLVKEYAMAAEIGDAEALEPRTLAKAKCHPDWPLWEKAINEELETLRQAGT